MPAVLAVLSELPFFQDKPLLIFGLDPLQIVFPALRKLVGIDKGIAARVVWRVNVDHLDLAVIGLLEDFQHFEVFAFNEDIFGLIEVDRFFSGGG
jgi:hypothetical protein